MTARLPSGPPIPYSLEFNAKLQIFRMHEDTGVPGRAYSSDAGYDLTAYLKIGKREMTATIAPKSTKNVKCGISLKAPPGHIALVLSRSGLAKNSIFVANSPGLIDPGYTGEIAVLLYNGGLEPYFVRHGDRVAQLILIPFAAPPIHIATEPFAETSRGSSGFGSTGR